MSTQNSRRAGGVEEGEHVAGIAETRLLVPAGNRKRGQDLFPHAPVPLFQRFGPGIGHRGIRVGDDAVQEMLPVRLSEAVQGSPL